MKPIRTNHVIPLWLALFCAAAANAQTPRTAPYRAAHRPNLELYVYRRCYAPDEGVSLRLSGFNVKSVQLAAYRIALPALIRNSVEVGAMGKRIAGLDLRSERPLRSWAQSMGMVYPDQWMEREAKVPRLEPGVYLMRAAAAGVEKRTWLAITDVALLAKRSRRELLVYATDARSGRPLPGMGLSVVDRVGHGRSVSTGTAGLASLPLVPRSAADEPESDNLWIYGMRSGNPAFLLSGAPPPPEPYAVYAYSDRPVYRPGQKVLFKGTVRQRLETDAPGGFSYRPYPEKPVVVEVRDATDALISRKELRTNNAGSYSGELQLASEPTLGRWQLVTVMGKRRYYSGFEVLAYRKPEFSAAVRFERPHYLGGDVVPATIEAQYYFGQPVAGATVRYHIEFSGRDVEPPFDGNGVTDARGQVRLEIKTQRKPSDRTLTVSAWVTDASRRTQTGAGSTLIAAGLFRLSLQPDRSVYHAGDRVTVEVRSEDYDGRSVSTPVTVRTIETRYDRQRRPYSEKVERRTATSADGHGTATFTPPRPGYLELQAEAYDSEHNKIVVTGYLWIAGEEFEGYDYPTLSIVPDRATYRPGEIATLLVNTSLVDGGRHTADGRRMTDGSRHRSASVLRPSSPVHKDAWALLTVDGERIYRHEVVHLAGRSSVIRLPISPAMYPSVEVSLNIVRDHSVYPQAVRLQVPMNLHELQVSIEPTRDRYAPGETASYRVTTRDARGQPVPAELGMYVVDSSICAMRPDTVPDAEGLFYGGQDARVQTDFSFAAQYSGGAFQNIPPAAKLAAPSPGEPQIRVRRQFADTAYWNPFLLTSEDGTARVSFSLPDNLTTWRATAHGLTADTACGTAIRDVVSTMPLLVRLELPRFYVDGDQAVFSAVVHNYTGQSRTVRISAEASGASLTGDAVRTVEIPANGQQRLDWRATVEDGGRKTEDGRKPEPSVPAQVRVLVTADGGEGAQDAMELTLPVRPAGVEMVTSESRSLSDPHGEWKLDLASTPPDATIALTLSPSIAGSVFETLGYLTSFPYGCAEQTTSAWLPDVVVSRALRKLGVNRQVHPKLEEWVNVGLQKLYRYQHPDGGWNWWEFDQTDGDMTSYVLWGLIEAKDAGYLVDEQRIMRGTEALLRLLASEQEFSRRADWMLTLAYVRPERIFKPLAELYGLRDKLDAHAKASLAMALWLEGASNAEHRQMAATVVAELERQAQVTGTTAHWPAEEGGYSWRDDDVEVTARVLRALLTVKPNSHLIQLAVRWLMGNRSGSAWGSSKSSAEAVYALTQFMETTGELKPDFRATVSLDGDQVGQVSSTEASAFDAPTVVMLKPEQWRGHATLLVRKEGQGTLYGTQTLRYLLAPDEAKPIAKGIAVRRTFRVIAEDPSRAGTVPSGEDIQVDVEITADANFRYALLEDPIPAGCEVAPTDDVSGRYVYGAGGGFARQEVRDDRVLFYFDSLPKGRTVLSYHLHAETPGAYRILPSSTWLMYFPEIRGSSALVQANIGEARR